MYHFFEAITNTKGDSLVGYFCRALDITTGDVITMSADDSGTPIETVSGVANMCKTDPAGMAFFYVAFGAYNLDIYAPDAATFIRRIPNIDMGAATALSQSASTTAVAAATTATTQAGLASSAATATAADRVQTGLDRAATTATAGSILTAGALVGTYPNAAASNVPRGLTQASVGAITAGSGGTNGTFALTWSGGNFSVNPTGTFTVAGGALTAVTITGPGQYIGASPTVPTPIFTASAGLTGAAVVLTAQFLPSSGNGYFVQSADGLSLLPYQNASGAATLVGAVGSVDTSVGVDTKFTIRGVGSASSLATFPGPNPLGSPAYGQRLLDGTLSANRSLAYGVSSDGTFLIGKYEVRLARAVQKSDAIEFGPYPTYVTGNVVLRYGAGSVTIRSTGTAQGSDGNRHFLDYIKGTTARVPLIISSDGTTRAIQRNTSYDVYTGAGSSAMGGAFAPTAADTTPIYPGRTLTLTGGPILFDATTRSGTAAFIDLAETFGGTGTFSSYFAASMFGKVMATRPEAKLVVVGHAVNGATATSQLDVGSTAGNDILASIGRVMTLAGATAGVNGNVRCPAHFLHFYDLTSIALATAVTNIIAYQASWQTGVQCVTGQVEPVYFFCSQCATQQKFAQTNSNSPSLYIGGLAMLAATRSVADGGSAYMFPTVADYILTYGDNQHPASGMTGQDLRAEYEAKTADVVLNQGRDFVGVRAKLPAAWTVTSSYIDIPCEVQVGPLLIDTAQCTDPGTDAGAIDANGKGFTLSDSNNCRITGVTVVGGGSTLRVAFSGTLGTGRNLEYAFTNGILGNSGRTAGPRGLVHDSDSTLSRDGTVTLYNPLWAFSYAF